MTIFKKLIIVALFAGTIVVITQAYSNYSADSYRIEAISSRIETTNNVLVTINQKLNSIIDLMQNKNR